MKDEPVDTESATSGRVAIETRALSKAYGHRVAVDQLSLRVPQGGIYGFLGPNGSGKTTTIRVLLGFLRPTHGQAAVFGRNAWRESAAIKREIGYMPGDIRLPHWLTCRRALGISAAAGHRSVLLRDGRQLADRFELDLDVAVSRMSRGMRQKLGLILALAHKPRLLILDEPTASLDPIVQARLYDVLREQATAGVTVFLSSHTLSEVEQLCDRVAILRTGRLVAEDSIASLRSRASRIAVITWRDDVQEVPPPTETLPSGCDVTERRDNRWTLAIHGPAAEFVRWCASRPIADVTIGEPDLTEVFHQYYQ